MLVHRNVKDDFWALPGGRVEFFENTDQTLIREIDEELGYSTKVIRPLWYVENFFEYDKRLFHEVSTYYLTKLTNDVSFEFEKEFNGIESDADLIFKWIPLENIAGCQLKPEFLKSKLHPLPGTTEFVQVNELGENRVQR